MNALGRAVMKWIVRVGELCPPGRGRPGPHISSSVTCGGTLVPGIKVTSGTVLAGDRRKFSGSRNPPTISAVVAGRLFGGPSMDRRRSHRVSVLLPVRVFGVDGKGSPFTQMARVTNISASGAVIQGMLRTMKTGEPLNVQLGQRTAEFQVVWTGKSGSRQQGEVGVQIIPFEPYIWDVNLGQCSELVGKG